MKPNSGSGESATKHSSNRVSDLLVITAGESAGIGPELCLRLVDTKWADRIVIVADPAMLAERARLLDIDVSFRNYGEPDTGKRRELCVLPQRQETAAVCGKPDPRNAASLLSGLRRAVKGCVDSEFAALVTAPLQKSTINDAGIPFSGHTEYLAELTATPTPVMLLAAADLRVALASTHLPLRAVADYLTTERIVDVLTVLHRDLRTKFRIAGPRIVVCGLNPHAGEGGHLGSEDAEIIAPAIRICRDRGFAVTGPVPADTAFTPAAGHADAVLAMYHDQGLPVIKYAGFGNAVNVTLGLPIIRTSVDHGTALDIAGTGNGDPGSLIAAASLAAELADR